MTLPNSSPADDDDTAAIPHAPENESAEQEVAPQQPGAKQDKRPTVARILRALAVPIVMFWVIVAIVLTIFVPSLEESTSAHAESLVGRDAPSSQAALIQGAAFKESAYTGSAVIVLETKGRKLGEQDHQFYKEMVRRLLQDSEHVQSLMDLWGQPVTMSGQQSADAEAATLTVRPTGDQGDAQSNRSIEAIRKIVDGLDKDKPSDLTVYVSGPGPLNTDTLNAVDESMGMMTVVTIVVIIVMLLLAYRSITRALIPLFGVMVTLMSARGIVSLLVQHHIIGISSFGMNMTVSLVLGVATDYGVFFLGRYQEARRAGQDRELAYYTSVASVSHVIVGSGIAISGATLCLSLTRLNYFKTLGPPVFVAMVIAVLAALTLGPALLAIGSKLPWLIQPVNASQFWRRFGTVIARWPAALIAVASLVIPLAIANLAFYTVSYNDRDFAPTTNAVKGYDAANRHYQLSQISNEILYIQADRDLRNPTDMINLDRIAKSIIRVPGISMVQGITRPNGRPLEHSSLPYSMGQMGTKIGQNIGFLRDRVADIDKMAATMGELIATTKEMVTLTQQMSAGSHLSFDGATQMKAAMEKTRDNLSNIDDFFRPLRNYLYWEPHCFDIPICWALRSMNESIDNIDEATEALGPMVDGLGIIDTVTPQLVTQLNATVQNMMTLHQLTLTMQSTFHATIDQMEPMINPMVAMAQAFDNAKNDDFFFMSPDAFDTENFKVGERFFVTPDGKGARIMIFHHGEAMSAEGIDQVRKADAAAHEAIKGTSLSNAKLYMAGAAATYRDVHDYAFNDTIIMMVATFSLVFLIIMFMIRALAGAVIVVIAVVLSFAGAMGLSTFIWETLLGLELHWLTLPIAFIVLVGVGTDYNLLLLSRYREELSAGVRTGLIRAIAGSGHVATIAVFVLAGTMAAMLSSDVIMIGMAGSTIAIGLIFDMLVVRLLLLMPIARLLGPWFWWPQKIPTRRRPRI